MRYFMAASSLPPDASISASITRLQRCCNIVAVSKSPSQKAACILTKLLHMRLYVAPMAPCEPIALPATFISSGPVIMLSLYSERVMSTVNR